jgi:O-antigen ligase
MVATVIFGIIDSFWVFSAVLSQGLGGRYIGILEIIPDELPYSILFLYLFYLSEKNIFIKAIKLFFLLLLSLSVVLTMGRGLFIISAIMFFSSTLIYFISRKKYLNLIMVFITAIIVSTLFISSSQMASTRYGSIVKGGENTNMRLYNWYSSILIIKKYPYTGVGLGNDTEYLKSYLPDSSPEIVKQFGGDTPHNEIFHFGIQTGVLGMVFVIFFYSSLIRRSFKILIQNQLRSQTLANALFSLSLGIFIWSLGNDVILAGKGSFVILITAFIDKIYNNEKGIIS